MKVDGYKVVTEAIDEGGIERGRFNRFVNTTAINLKSIARQYLMSFKVWLWPTYLWSDAVNVCKLLSRIGTGKNQDFKIDLMHLMQAAASGKFKTGKEFNNAVQAVMKKHNFRKQRLFDHVEQ